MKAVTHAAAAAAVDAPASASALPAPSQQEPLHGEQPNHDTMHNDHEPASEPRRHASAPVPSSHSSASQGSSSRMHRTPRPPRDANAAAASASAASSLSPAPTAVSAFSASAPAVATPSSAGPSRCGSSLSMRSDGSATTAASVLLPFEMAMSREISADTLGGGGVQSAYLLPFGVQLTQALQVEEAFEEARELAPPRIDLAQLSIEAELATMAPAAGASALMPATTPRGITPRPTHRHRRTLSNQVTIVPSTPLPSASPATAYTVSPASLATPASAYDASPNQALSLPLALAGIPARRSFSAIMPLHDRTPSGPEAAIHAAATVAAVALTRQQLPPAALAYASPVSSAHSSLPPSAPHSTLHSHSASREVFSPATLLSPSALSTPVTSAMPAVAPVAPPATPIGAIPELLSRFGSDGTGVPPVHNGTANGDASLGSWLPPSRTSSPGLTLALSISSARSISASSASSSRPLSRASSLHNPDMSPIAANAVASAVAAASAASAAAAAFRARYSEDNPDFQSYKRAWEVARHLQASLERLGHPPHYFRSFFFSHPSASFLGGAGSGAMGAGAGSAAAPTGHHHHHHTNSSMSSNEGSFAALTPPTTSLPASNSARWMAAQNGGGATTAKRGALIQLPAAAAAGNASPATSATEDDTLASLASPPPPASAAFLALGASALSGRFGSPDDPAASATAAAAGAASDVSPRPLQLHLRPTSSSGGGSNSGSRSKRSTMPMPLSSSGLLRSSAASSAASSSGSTPNSTSPAVSGVLSPTGAPLLLAALPSPASQQDAGHHKRSSESGNSLSSNTQSDPSIPSSPIPTALMAAAVGASPSSTPSSYAAAEAGTVLAMLQQQSRHSPPTACLSWLGGVTAGWSVAPYAAHAGSAQASPSPPASPRALMLAAAAASSSSSSSSLSSSSASSAPASLLLPTLPLRLSSLREVQSDMASPGAQHEGESPLPTCA